ncbi:MAG: hypothetical protein IPI23_10720 [Bacteroidetes bacterium]|nr:hypothetical protein [Bacteroidota bacterium]
MFTNQVLIIMATRLWRRSFNTVRVDKDSCGVIGDLTADGKYIFGREAENGTDAEVMPG